MAKYERLCAEYAAYSGGSVELVAVPTMRARRLAYVYYATICCGKHGFRGPLSPNPGTAYRRLAEKLCDPDKWFDASNRCPEWRHFGRLSGCGELELRLAAAGSSSRSGNAD